MDATHAMRMAALSSLRLPLRLGRARQPRVLLLTSGLGTGHSRAAAAVEQQLRGRLPQARIQTLDFWSLLDAAVAAAVQRTYLHLVNDRPDLYQRLYQLDQHSWRDILENGRPLPSLVHELVGLIAPLERTSHGERHWLDRLLFRQLKLILSRNDRTDTALRELWQQATVHRSWMLLANRLQRRIEAFAPDIVVATQVNMAALAAHLKARRQLSAPLCGIITDYGVHDFWLQRHIDAYFVADESMTGRLAEFAWSAEKICVSGIPLLPEFIEPPPVRTARQQLDLSTERPVVLILGGGLGLGIESVVRTLAQALSRQDAAAQLLVLTGRNQQIIRELERDTAVRGEIAAGRIRLHGWTEHVARFIRAADLVVGKPGGLTTAEVLACGRPLFSTCSLRGQESFNVAFLESHGIGQLLDEEALPGRIRGLLEDRLALQRMQARAWALGKRHGAAQVAERICDLLPQQLVDHALGTD